VNRVVLSRAAREDLERIDDYSLREFGLKQAQKMLVMFEDAFELLASFPASAPERPELDPPGRRFRYRTVSRCFVVVYEGSPEGIRVARVLDGRRADLRGLLEKEAGEAR